MMWGQNALPVPAALFDVPEEEMPSPEAIDELRSALIVAYEQALQKGISPSCALVAILDMASVELGRCVAG